MAAAKTEKKSQRAENLKKKDKIDKIAPDGGWGWLVVAAFGLNFVVIIPIFQNFGLLFGDTFRYLEFSDTAVSVLINANYSVGVCVGLFNGPILRTFAFRTVGVVGSSIIFLGMFLTSFAGSFWQFLLYYGFLMAIGSGLSLASFQFAVNSYFKKRRGMAMGIAMTAAGLGPVVMPHVIGYGISEFGARGTSLLLAGLSLHSLVGALLLQPVEWHMKPAPVDEEMKVFSSEEHHTHRMSTVLENPEEQEAMLPKAVNGHSKAEHHSSMASVRSATGSRTDLETPNKLHAYPWWNSGTSLDTVDLGNTLRAANELESHCVIDADDPDLACKDPQHHVDGQLTLMKPDSSPQTAPATTSEVESEKVPKKSCMRGCFRGFVRFFDLDLLKDPIYVNLMLGMSIAVFAEVNFSLLMPFILKERELSTPETATMLSLIATADIVFRFLAPFIGKACRMPSRIMYAGSLCLLVVSRTTFLFAETYSSMLAVMLFLGMAKGIRTVFWVLVIPDYVPLDRLPGASGIQSVTNGLISLACGPLLGILKDRMGNFTPIIIVLNALTMLTVTMWAVEIIVVRMKKKVKAKQKPKPS